MAVASPIRAVLTAHFESTVNRMRKQLGRTGFIGLLFFLGVFAFVGVVPLLLLATVGSYFLAREAFVQHTGHGLDVMFGVGFTVLPLFGGLIGGVSGGSQQLAWEQYRAYPVTPRTLFLAELVAGFGDVTAAVISLMLLGAGAAVALAAPAHALASVVLAIEAVVLMLSVQLLVGSLANRLAQRLRFALAVLLVSPGVFILLVRPWLEKEERTGFKSSRHAWELASTLAAWLPSSMTFQPGARAWLGAAAQALAVGAVVVTAAVMLWREHASSPDDSGGPVAPPWTFTRPVLGIARLQLVTLLGSHLGKGAFILPVIAVVLLRGFVAELTGRTDWMVPGAFLYTSFAATGLAFNQFGLDGHGVKALFLLPITEQQILKGKQLGYAGWQAMQVALLVVLLGVMHQPSLEHVAIGLLLFVCLFFLQGAVGQFFSTWLPRRLSPTSMKNGQVPITVALASLGTSLGGMAVFGGALFGLRHSPIPPVVGMAALALGCFLASRPALRFNARFLAENRDRVIEAVG